jgi:hypothetical protein
MLLCVSTVWSQIYCKLGTTVLMSGEHFSASSTQQQLDYPSQGSPIPINPDVKDHQSRPKEVLMGEKEPDHFLREVLHCQNHLQ